MMINLNVHTIFHFYLVIYLMDKHYVLSMIPNCPFGDTVELTDKHRLSNGTYHYEGVLIPPHLIGYYDYLELYEENRQQVPRHLRGCVCQIKNCFKLCCPPGNALFGSNGECGNFEYSPYVNVTLSNGSEVLKNALEEFVVQVGQPCKGGYVLEQDVYIGDQWKLYENGTLWRKHDNVKFTRRDYCMTANSESLLLPYNCPIKNVTPLTLEVNTIVMLISLPFLYLTILTYWTIPELYKILHNKCLICYLFSLAIANTMLIWVNMRTHDFSTVTCTIIGLVAYYFYLGAFFWLNVICFDIWLTFCRDMPKLSPNSKSKRRHFAKYSLYAWGLPMCMTVVTLALQLNDIPIQFQSGIGVTHCWLKVEDWSAMLYFHGPCLLLITINTVLFCLSARKIYSDRKRFEDVSRNGDSAKQLKSQEHSVWLFFRLFVVMGVIWILEMLGYMLGQEMSDAWYFQIADIYNASQGIIIFSLFVIKKKQLQLIKERLTTLKWKICTCLSGKL